MYNRLQTTLKLTAALLAILAWPLGAAEEQPFRLMTLAPGHFHAALVQKQTYPDVSPVVPIYAPPGPDLALHLDRIEKFNTRAEKPTAWKTINYTGDDYREKMIAERPGNVVVIAGNNRDKTRHIFESIRAGFHVLADKPMAITPDDFQLLKQAIALAAEKKLLLLDIMTERHEITTRLQRFFAHREDLFGGFDPGSPEDPSVTKESVHHFYKTVAGAPLQRPQWFYDARQQGEGIVDVTTHLVDMVQWELFPERAIGLDESTVLSARTWKTGVSLEQFARSTKTDAFPDYLRDYLDEKGTLQIPYNGEFVFRLGGIHAKVSVTWNYEAPAGAGDTHYSLMRGKKIAAVIRQGAAQNYRSSLYLEPRPGVKSVELEAPLKAALAEAQRLWPGVDLQKTEAGWEVVIPASYRIGHEAHFGQVTENFLRYLRANRLPDWETPNMLAKYRTIMDAYQMSRQ
jgi:predicted dehydrogenase